MAVVPFRINVPDNVVHSLRSRLAQTRFAPRTSSEPWASGIDPGYLRELVASWADTFDWRASEQALNTVPQYYG